MGTASLIAGIGLMMIGFAVIAQGFLGTYFTTEQFFNSVLFNVIIGIPLIVLGAYFLKQYDITKKKAVDTKKDIQYKTQQERNLKKSPILQGVLLGVILILIFWGIFILVYNQTFTMANDALSPDVMKGELMHHQRTPFNEIKVGDIIAFIPSDKDEFGTKIGIVRIIGTGSYVQTSNNVNPNTLSQVFEKDYVGKITSVTSQVGLISVYSAPYHLVITVILFVIPIVIMKIREKKSKNS